ncbi:hypothetical protein EDD18DRAFT_1108520 [Armillaria luteobubalina]|uniref:Uncharacterized protein n=1 Tax=Armillaria luteobubalina TaxID=153913 RepID=A0AA39UQF6_9AGAR|nr:hypothetical protein EDD18DRAFT_1108520 [Armillaria luteobubalina]
MSVYTTPALLPTHALSNTSNPGSGGDIVRSSPSQCTDKDSHLTSDTRAAPETRNIVTKVGKEGRCVNSYSSRYTLTDPKTLREDAPDGSTPIDWMLEYLSHTVNFVKEMRELTSAPGAAEKPLLPTFGNSGSRDEECQDSNNAAPREQSSSPTPEVLSSDSSPTGIVISRPDQEPTGKQVASPTLHTLFPEEVSFYSVSDSAGTNLPPPVDIIASTGTSSVIVITESSPDCSTHTTQILCSRASSPTDSLRSLSETAVDDEGPEDTDPNFDMLESRLAYYKGVKESISNDLPLTRLKGIKEAFDLEEVFEFLHGICADCPEPLLSRVSMVPASETLSSVCDATPPVSTVKVDTGKPMLPMLSLENGRFCTIEHLCKFLGALPHCFVVLNIQLLSVESVKPLQHNLQTSFDHITHLDIFESTFESINIIADLLCCLPSLSTGSLHNILILKLQTDIGSYFKGCNKLKLANIIVRGKETHSMGEITKLLFQGDKNALLFNKSAVEHLELIWPALDEGSHPYYINEENGRTFPCINAEKIDNVLYFNLKFNFVARAPGYNDFHSATLKPFHSSSWNSVASKARKLERIMIDITWDETWSSACPWAKVLGHLDVSLWPHFKCESDWWPKLKTLILQTKNFPPYINIVGDAFQELFKVDPVHFNEVKLQYTFNLCQTSNVAGNGKL